MTFKVGETVVYPHHGAATIEEIVNRKIKGVGGRDQRAALINQPRSGRKNTARGVNAGTSRA